ncbi:flavodoxin domain-containing protein [Caldalkalibacillus mannanilyticus]|uniref:flavodoxin domain-containing protein n=1 Tax=Caldalkalibacillus mannanilyticus TaxID=1418 RepID=UPI000469E79D|nr:flavodoxin domain-containing protein [Caldalkalibacillus mannanilyticus]
MNVAIIYTSKTRNTEALSYLIYDSFRAFSLSVTIFTIDEFSLSTLDYYDGLIIGSYTWGNGEIPKEMDALYAELEARNLKHLTTGVFGTGDSFYPHFCGAVDHFRDMLFVRTTLAVTLKVELHPQPQDHLRCQEFARLFLKRLISLKH